MPNSNEASPQSGPTPIIREPLMLSVTGTLPDYLSTSTLYRIGPGKVNIRHSDGVPYKLRHYFDSPGFLHIYSIDASTNSVTYRNLFLGESKLRAIANTPSSPKANHQCFIHNFPGKGLVACTDGVDLLKIDENSVAADHFFKYEDLLHDADGNFSCAHGHYDEERGEFINFTYKFGGSPVTYKVFKLKQDDKSSIIAEFEETPRYLHSFAVTDKYVIMILWPLTVHGLKIWFHQNKMAGLHYNDSEPTLFIVISRAEDRVVAKYTSESFFCFHQVNAFDTEDGVVIDMSHYQNADILNLNDVSLFDMIVLEGCSLARITLDGLSDAILSYPKTSRDVTTVDISKCGFELPTINSKFSRKDYRYAYGFNTFCSGIENRMVLVKVDVRNGKKLEWGQNNTLVSEPVFVADPAGLEEDDGCILSLIADKNEMRSSVVVLDARTMTEIARAVVPILTPLGFHGMFAKVWKLNSKSHFFL
ncbi:Beta,beta-carotene 9',10'-oxygenase [Gracilariopsis chorda]|uniref:Beta,beta-carotene 9',10'-oxygenase n=1 Tax=Gracilariopsis chorda TaxID=448386 RepID=A0A2V3J434_9FLOR|nr:Beta,beta-carotene 9',10'-oxygenase [Gracilariopsis chorda]|eukprot:PXF49211.1 Beta,beta-carotene 9',10'-oxygenase [Gracilariopsis chorda]